MLSVYHRLPYSFDDKSIGPKSWRKPMFTTSVSCWRLNKECKHFHCSNEQAFDKDEIMGSSESINLCNLLGRGLHDSSSNCCKAHGCFPFMVSSFDSSCGSILLCYPPNTILNNIRMIERTSELGLFAVTGITCAVGVVMFLLPPVPGVPVYLTLGIVLTARGYDTMGM